MPLLPCAAKCISGKYLNEITKWKGKGEDNARARLRAKLGYPISARTLADHNEVPSFGAAYRGHTLRHFTRASRELVDVKPRKQIICNRRFEREIKLVRL